MLAFFSATLDSGQSYSQFQGSLRQALSAKGTNTEMTANTPSSMGYHR